jgi:hypothetical protein
MLLIARVFRELTSPEGLPEVGRLYLQIYDLFTKHKNDIRFGQGQELSLVPAFLYNDPSTRVYWSTTRIITHSDPDQSDSWIRIKAISWIRIRNNLQMTSQNVWNTSLIEHFYLEARIWIRFKVKGRIRIQRSK